MSAEPSTCFQGTPYHARATMRIASACYGLTIDERWGWPMAKFHSEFISCGMYLNRSIDISRCRQAYSDRERSVALGRSTQKELELHLSGGSQGLSVPTS